MQERASVADPNPHPSYTVRDLLAGVDRGEIDPIDAWIRIQIGKRALNAAESALKDRALRIIEEAGGAIEAGDRVLYAQEKESLSFTHIPQYQDLVKQAIRMRMEAMENMVEKDGVGRFTPKRKLLGTRIVMEKIKPSTTVKAVAEERVATLSDKELYGADHAG